MAGLALAEAPGLPVDLWRLAVHALTGHDVTTQALAAFAAGSAANFLIETGLHDGRPAYRLYHQALNDALLHRRAQVGHRRQDDERALAQAFLTDTRERGWEQVSRYVVRSLAGHAARGGLIDQLLHDEDYLLRADLRRLAEPADDAVTPEGQARARLLHLTPQALDTAPRNAEPSSRSPRPWRTWEPVSDTTRHSPPPTKRPGHQPPHAPNAPP